MSSSRIHIGSFAILACAMLLGGAGCGPRPTTTTPPPNRTTPTSKNPVMPGFKLFESMDEGFTIQYPETWSVREKEKSTIVSFISPLQDKKDAFAENINVVSEILGGNSLSLEEYYKYSEANLRKFFADFKLLKNESTVISGLPGRIVVYTTNQNQLKLRTTQIFTIKNGKAYIITITNSQADPNQHFEDMMKIAQSFRFN